MASFMGNPWGVIVGTEAAGNSAALSACSIITPMHNEFTASGGTFEFAHDIWINGVTIFGDTANITRVVIGGTAASGQFSGGRYPFDARENFPAETSTASATGFHDLRWCPIHVPAEEVMEVQWTENASTNVEPAVIIYYSLGGPLGYTPQQVAHSMDPGSCFTVTLAQSATTAVTWTRSTNIMGPNNGDTTAFEPDSTYIVAGMRSTGSATMKAAVLELAGLEAYPGIHGMTALNVSAIPEFSFWNVSPVSCTGAELNRATTATVDVAGSETPTHLWYIRKQ